MNILTLLLSIFKKIKTINCHIKLFSKKIRVKYPFIKKRGIMSQKLLIEIGVEELPAAPLLKELQHIELKWQKILEEYHLYTEFNFFYTPRRLILLHEHFSKKQEDSLVEFIGAPKDIAYKDGKLTPAGQSFLQKTGISESKLQFKTIKGKEVLYYQEQRSGKESSEILGQMVEKWLQSLNFGKTMRWGSGEFEFIRAIRSLVCVLGDKLIEFQSYGVKSAKKTFVHRSMSYDLIHFQSIDEYFTLLEKNFVMIDQNKRRKKILAEFNDLERQNDIHISEDDELLSEVVAITEYPKVLLGSFEDKFLAIPSEVIISSMRENQRYFSVFKNDKLSNHFIVVSNAVCKDYTKIINGNERVLRARLSDAMFFWENDLKSGLHPEKLDSILYLEGLGTMQDKIEREKAVAKVLCESYKNAHLKDIKTAIDYTKADLLTSMVYEFPELQGIMGSYYAKAQGLSDAICLAIREQYLPNTEKDALPSTEFSSIVALANKIDTLMGLFSLGKIPTGTKDPYALRRAANGVIKIALHLGIKFDIREILQQLSALYKQFELKNLENFIFERLYTFYNANASFIKAVLASQNTDLIHIDASIKALIDLSQDEHFDEKFSTFKRLANIAVKPNVAVDECLFEQEQEKNLYQAFKARKQNAPVSEMLHSLFSLKNDIDAFFDKVMINTENESLRTNRQALVYEIYEAFLKIADIKELSL